jgi:hypothetical protein
MEPAARKPDPVFDFLGKVFKSPRLQAYAAASAKDIPAEVRDRLMSYRMLLLVLAGAFLLPLIHARLWTLGAAVVICIGVWPLKLRSEKGLDADVAPYSGDAPAGPGPGKN